MVHNQAELDLLVIKNGRKIGFECKRSDSPRLTPSMHIAVKDLALDSLFVIYPGNRPYSLGKKISTLPLHDLITKHY